MRVLIVDDERLARAVLRRLLEGHADIEIVGEAASVGAAADVLREREVDLVFLDVQMPGDDGFALFEHIERPPRVVFVTAHDRFAVRAFEVHALDYLLKPVSPERLAAAIERVRASSAPRPLEVRAEPLDRDELACLPTRTGMRFFRIREITHLTAADDYVEVHLGAGEAVLSSTPLKDWEQRLPDDFVRVHRSAVVNLTHVEGVARDGTGFSVRIRGGRTVAMSRRFASRILDELGQKLR